VASVPCHRWQPTAAGRRIRTNQTDRAAAEAERGIPGIYPLQNGWTVAVARHVPPEPPDEECCHGIEEPDPGLGGCCAEWVFAQLGPTGRWTKAQTLPHSKGTLIWVSKPVEHRRHIAIAWGRSREGEDVHVAVAPLGGVLTPARRAEPLLPRRKAEEAYVSAAGNRLYEVGEYGRGVIEYRPS
jgi:hypothetical protein